jgi:hypothetical protein
MTTTILKPRKICVPVSTALNWKGPDVSCQRKYDGIFEIRTIGFGAGHVAELAGEAMKFKSGGLFTSRDREMFARFGSWYAAFDLLALDGQDMRGQPLRLRWRELARIVPYCGVSGDVILADSGFGGDFVGAVLAAGGEGACAKPWGSTWFDPFYAAKPLQTFRCRVVGLCGGKQAVQLADADTGQPRGMMRLSEGKICQIRVGSLLKVCGYLNPSGAIREARCDADSPGSWLIQH